jgi:tetratricopeptide (TPR) repeat protein
MFFSILLQKIFMKALLALCILTFTWPSYGQVENDPLIGRVDQLINNHQYELALSAMDASTDSADFGLMQRRGFCHSRLGNYSAAITEFEKITTMDSLNRNALFQLGHLYSRNNQYQQARKCYHTLISLDSTNSYYYKQFANTAFQVNDLVTAAAYYLRTVQLNPQDIEAYSALGNILLETEQYQLADSLLSLAVRTTNHPQLTILWCRALLGAEKFQEVLDLGNTLITNGDTSITAARLLGVSYFQLQRYNLVIPCMKMLISSGVESDWVYYYLGVAYQQTGNPEVAIEYLNHAIEAGISDNISMYYTQLAVAYEEKKDLKSAIRFYKAAYETSKSDILLYHLARNYDDYYKDKAQAIAYYKRYLNSDDTISLTRQYSQYRLEQLKNYK